MPPRWPRQPDRKDPEYRRLDDRMNFAIHVGIYLMINSGLWFVSGIKNVHWPWETGFTLSWLAIVLLHLLYIAAIADYSPKSDS
ncbi:2TM domain-containing protein [Spirulina sp. 06S082]|uniref:2TM domain-containing protein n=1 Tax=Spirulina sp. 06S082 TaxID=3110248 RepID=UPI002B1FAAE2|nr:2TM domain-containing protein [Spirulina sp. 06S082]MEA5471101.1 2TM domain-containing protein [Spirulina sp. 06S082]